jgi:hypothetical protein
MTHQRTPARPRPGRCALAALLLASTLAPAACTTLGWRFGPGFSSEDRGLFAGRPVVEHRGDRYFLTWTYGPQAFFFRPGYQARDGRLVVSLQGSSSSGHVAGRVDAVPIEGAANVQALQRGGAFWWEPDGRFVRLDIVEPGTRP